MLYTLIRVIFPRVILYAGVLELVDEADSKSVGLIPRAGSTPATGTTIKQHHEVISRRRRRSFDRWCCFFHQIESAYTGLRFGFFVALFMLLGKKPAQTGWFFKYIIRKNNGAFRLREGYNHRLYPDLYA